MATYTPYWFGNGLLNVLKGNIDMDSDTFKLSLHTSTYTPDQDAHDYRNDLTNEVANGNGYTTGGLALSSLALTYDSSTNQVRWDVADPSWTFTASPTWRWGVISKIRGGASSADELLCWIDFGGAQTVTAGTFTIQFAATGVLKTTV